MSSVLGAIFFSYIGEIAEKQAVLLAVYFSKVFCYTFWDYVRKA